MVIPSFKNIIAGRSLVRVIERSLTTQLQQPNSFQPTAVAPHLEGISCHWEPDNNREERVRREEHQLQTWDAHNRGEGEGKGAIISLDGMQVTGKAYMTCLPIRNDAKKQSSLVYGTALCRRTQIPTKFIARRCSEMKLKN